jgi:hypothetical protein
LLQGTSVSRHFMLKKGSEHGMPGPPASGHGGRDSSGGHRMEAPKPGGGACLPTWAQPSADGSRIFVACNASSDIVEVDATSWTTTRRIPAGDGVYNLATTRELTHRVTRHCERGIPSNHHVAASTTRYYCRLLRHGVGRGGQWRRHPDKQ